jgi:hypothetical protein
LARCAARSRQRITAGTIKHASMAVQLKTAAQGKLVVGAAARPPAWWAAGATG